MSEDIIERAAWAMWREDGEPDGVAKRDPYRKLARALAAAGLLAQDNSLTILALALQRIENALTVAQEMREQLVSGPELEDVLRIIAALTGTDAYRPAPTGESGEVQ